MIFSKLSAPKAALLGSCLALTFSLTACLPKTQDRPNGSESGGANFVVSSVSGSIGGTKNIGEFPLPGEKTYNFKACLIDYARRTNIPNGKFLIQENGQQLMTDAQGCLNWVEVVKFNYLADSVWLKMTRTIEAQGLQRGNQQVKFAINPWSHGENLAEVIDLSKQNTPYLLEGADEVKVRLASLEKVRRVWVENGELNVSNGKMLGKNYVWHDQIFLKPQILFAKTDATPVLVPILHGSFMVEVSLISEDIQGEKAKRILWAKQVVKKANISNNTLMIDVDFSLAKGPSSGQTFLGIKLIPLGAPAGLQAFEGVFPLSGIRAFTESAALKISQSVATENAKGQFTVSSFLGEAASATAAGGANEAEGALQTGTDHAEQAGVKVEHIDIKDFKIVSEQGQNKILSYQVHACLSDKVGKFGLKNRNFQVQISGPSGQAIENKTVNTEDTSCLIWEGRTEQFDRNECRHYLNTTVRVKNADLGLDQVQNILINPWMEKGIDQRLAKDSQQYPLSCDGAVGLRRADSFISLRHLSLEKTDYRPQVLDRTLQITQMGKYQVTMSDPGIVDYSNESTGSATSPKAFSAGKYLLRLAFVRDAQLRSDNGYVTHADVIMDVHNGGLSGTMELQINDLQSTMVRKMVLAQLFPIDMEKYNAVMNQGAALDYDQLIDRKTKLLSPVYYSKTATLAMPAPLSLRPLLEENKTLTDIIQKGFKKDIKSNNLVREIVLLGEASQAALIKKNAFNEQDGAAWHKWNQKQGIKTTWLHHEKGVEALKQDFNIKGDAKLELQNLIDMKELNAGWARKFCGVLFNKTLKGVLIGAPTNKVVNEEFPEGIFDNDFYVTCLQIVRRNPSAFIKKSPAYRILEMSPGILRANGLPNSNLSVSSGFGYTTGHTEIEGTQAGLTLTGGIGGSVANILSAGLGASYGAVRMVTDDRNRHSGTDLNKNLNLVETRWQFDIPVHKYQQCTMLRLDPSVFINDKSSSWFNPFSWDSTKSTLRSRVDISNLFRLNDSGNPLLQGWLICSDQTITNEISLPETYYLVSQPNSDNESLDSLDGENKRFFLPIRGASDMARFKATLSGSLTYPKNGELTDEAVSDLTAQILPLLKRMDPAPGMIMPNTIGY